MASSSNSLSQTYQKKSDKEHILDNPDTYVGSVENVESTLYIFERKRKLFKNQHLCLTLLYLNCLMRVL